MFFNNRIEKNLNQTHSEEGTSESLYYLALIPPCIYATISVINIAKGTTDPRVEFSLPK